MIDTSDRVATTDTTVSGADRRDGTRSGTINYDAQRMIGHGSFGAGNFSWTRIYIFLIAFFLVYLAKNTETNELIAIKKVLQDRRFKNRELQIMKQLAKRPHPYIGTLI